MNAEGTVGAPTCLSWKKEYLDESSEKRSILTTFMQEKLKNA
jgi:hypothetical protein